MDNSDDLIPGIYNYCDRWCERCEFNERCRLFAEQQRHSDLGPDSDGEGLARALRVSLAEAAQLINEHFEELGIKPEPISIEEFSGIREREMHFLAEQRTPALADEYLKAAKDTLHRPDLWLESAQGRPNEIDDSEAYAFETLHHDAFQIPVLVTSAFHCLLDFNGTPDESEIDDPESHANGKMKTALVVIDRSIAAWKILRHNESAAVIQPLTELLTTIRDQCEKRFPLARDFVRPGFDEIGEVEFVM